MVLCGATRRLLIRGEIFGKLMLNVFSEALTMNG